MSSLRGTLAGSAPEGPHNRLPEAGDPAFNVDSSRAVGIRFYPGRGAFFLPYGQLQSVSWAGETLVLSYATDTVTLVGSSLHDLFIELAENRVNRIHAERGGASKGDRVEVTEIIRLPRG